MPAKASLDHYVGRNVVNVEDYEDGFFIELDGDVKIVNESADVPKPDSVIVGTTLLIVQLSNDVSELLFGTAQEGAMQYSVALEPTKYRIADPQYSEEQRPQAAEVDQTHADFASEEPQEPAGAEDSDEEG